jgi:hypothetical protein
LFIGVLGLVLGSDGFVGVVFLSPKGFGVGDGFNYTKF